MRGAKASLLAAGIAVLAVDASAACNQASIGGTWRYFENSVSFRDELSVVHAWTKDCRLQINLQGTPTSSTCTSGADEPFGPVTFLLMPTAVLLHAPIFAH